MTIILSGNMELVGAYTEHLLTSGSSMHIAMVVFARVELQLQS
jgi:hypothetical protein